MESTLEKVTKTADIQEKQDKCVYCKKLVDPRTAYFGEVKKPYCNKNCFDMFTES